MAHPKGKVLHERFRRASVLRAGLNEASAGARLIAGSVFLREFIDSDLLAQERDLQSTRWIEYRYMNPLQCTQLFTELYDEMARHFHGKYFDTMKVNDIQPIKKNYASNGRREISQIWRARQEADRIGVPYRIFIRESMESMLTAEGHKKIPRPNQLYSVSPLKYVVSKWKDLYGIEQLFRDEWDPKFFAEKYQGDPVQQAALQMLIERVQSSRHPEIGLRHFLVTAGAISEQEARRRLGDHLVDQALVGNEVLVSDSPLIAPRQHVPACFGLSLDQSHTACSVCPVALSCIKVTGMIDEKLTERFGHVDVRDANRRAENRRRQQKCRARKRSPKNSQSCAAA